VKTRRFIFEAAVLIVASIVCAAVANAFAPRERKLTLISKISAPTVPGPGSRVPGPALMVPGPESRVPSPQPATPAPTATVAATPEEKMSEPLAKRDPGPGTRDPGPAAKPREFPPHPDKPWVEIDSASVRELYARGVPFIDARRTSVYEEGHIKGARSIPVWESDLDQRLAALYELGYDPEAPVVVYCSGGNCEDSHMLAQRLWGIGFNNVLVYKDGYPDWVKHGGLTEKGPGK
jgi:rhodanese-related sulfurtransferase